MAIEEKPSRNEDEYFAKQDAELLKARRARIDEERLKAERSAHQMKCPKCGGQLIEREFEHMKIDVCTDCEGTWLDPGELEMLGRVNRGAITRFISDLLEGIRRT